MASSIIFVRRGLVRSYTFSSLFPSSCSSTTNLMRTASTYQQQGSGARVIPVNNGGPRVTNKTSDARAVRSISDIKKMSSAEGRNSSKSPGALLFASAAVAAGFLGVAACDEDTSRKALPSERGECENVDGKHPKSYQPRQLVEKRNIVRECRHRVALTEWPAAQCSFNGDPRTADLHALCRHVKASGYDGMEMTVGYYSKFIRNASKEEVAKKAKEILDSYGLQNFGSSVWWAFDYPSQDWEKELEGIEEEARLVKLMGGEYLTFQMWLTPEYMDSGGAYRRDEAYLDKSASRIRDLQNICWAHGLNCYVETHVGRISEDPQAFAMILKRVDAPVEINGDLSHYIYRNMRNDTDDMKEILGRMGHTHQRMCKPYGDLSANVPDPRADWNSRGLTWKAFQFSKMGLRGGLSSRVIAGESGPMHDVYDPLTLDASLVPLYRMMAEWADKSAAGQEVSVDRPEHWNPFREEKKKRSVE